MNCPDCGKRIERAELPGHYAACISHRPIAVPEVPSRLPQRRLAQPPFGLQKTLLLVLGLAALMVAGGFLLRKWVPSGADNAKAVAPFGGAGKPAAPEPPPNANPIASKPKSGDQSGAGKPTAAIDPRGAGPAQRSEAANPLFPPERDPLQARKQPVEAKPASENYSESRIRIVITPLRNKNFGIIYGAEARDERSHKLLSVAKQVGMQGHLLVVDETQYSWTGEAVYKARLFFDAGDQLVKEQKISGEKRWDIFFSWLHDGF